MTASKTAPRKRGAVARSELKGQPKSIDYRKLKLSIPAKAPSDLFWDSGSMDLHGAMQAVFGPEQCQAIRQKQKDVGLDMDATIAECDTLLGRCMSEKWGMSQGE